MRHTPSQNHTDAAATFRQASDAAVSAPMEDGSAVLPARPSGDSAHASTDRRTQWFARNLIKSLPLLLAVLGFAPASFVAAELRTSPEQAAKFIQDLGNRVVTLLASYVEAGEDSQPEELKTIVRQAFDLDAIGRFALGDAWQSATPTQQQEYQKLFMDWTIDTYARRLGAAKGVGLAVVDAKSFAETDALISARIDRPDGISFAIDLRVRGTDGQMKIVDMLMGGVSMDVTQRDEFTSVVRRQGLVGLIGKLKSRIGNLQTAAGRG